MAAVAWRGSGVARSSMAAGVACRRVAIRRRALNVVFNGCVAAMAIGNRNAAALAVRSA